MFKKAQAAMEYIMTYGWAILVILIVIAALFFLGVFSPSTPSTCSIEAPFVCSDIQIDEGGVTFILGNVNINSISNVGIKVNGVDCNDNEIVIDGDYTTGASGIKNKKIKVECMGLSLDAGDKISTEVSFDYSSNNLDHSIKGEGYGMVEEGNVHTSAELILHMDGDIIDSSKNNYVGSIEGDVDCSVEGYLGQGCYFDNSVEASQINFGDILDIGLDDLTISAWIKTIDSKVLLNYIWKNIGGFGEGYSTRLYYGKLSYNIKDDYEGVSSFNTLSEPDIRDGDWHHVVVVFDRDDSAYLYVDGNPPPYGYDLTDVNVDIQNSVNFMVGGRGYNGQSLTGTLDEVMVWKRALSSIEVQNLFSSY